MSSGFYGNIRPANINIDRDVEILYSYAEYKGMKGTDYTVIPNVNLEKSTYDNKTIVDGVYNLQLPPDIFTTKGYYTIIIKPKEYTAKVADIGNLVFQTDIKGVVINSNEDSGSNPISNILTSNGELCGYRLDVVEDNGKKDNSFMIITSNNKVEPTNQTTTNNSQKSVSYRFNDNMNLWFLTVSASNGNFLKDEEPTIELNVGDDITITNTFFNPVMMEVEIVENDFDTLAIMVGGNQTRSLDEGIITTYDSNNNIFKQTEIYTLKNIYTGKPVYEVRENKETIDLTKEFDSVKNG